ANRVTLKMDVSHTDHSHIIGRRGQSINKVMDETNCHIHFPDSNRGSASAEKSNQVSITGQPEGVEKARARIREMSPLVICFEIPHYDSMFLPLDPTSPPIQNISQRYDVTFSTKGRTQVGLIVAVRGSQDRVSCIKDAIDCLFKQLTGSSEIPNVVQLYLDVAPQHHMFLIGESACNLRNIMLQTAAKIELPDPRAYSRHGMITVTGSVNAVIQARALLVNCLPLLLMFDLKEEEARHLQDQPEKVKQIETKFFVSITIKPKPKQSSKSVTIKSKENNAQNMYLTRLEILGNPMDPQIMQHPPPLAPPFLHSTSWFAANQTSIDFSPYSSPYTSPLASPTPHSISSIRSDSPVFHTRRTPPPTNLKCPPGFDLWGRHHRSESFNNGEYHRRTNSADNNLSKVVRDAVSEGGSPNESYDFMVPRRNSEPTSYAEAWKSSSNGSQSKAPGSSARNTPRTSPPRTSPPRSSSPRTSEILNTQQRYTFLEGTKNAGSHKLLDSHGSNPASSFDSLASVSFNMDRCMNSSPTNKFADYERKKGISTELMTKKVDQSQVRVPTDLWSGLHLSKSADFEALKKKEVSRLSPSRFVKASHAWFWTRKICSCVRPPRKT
ncbi:bicaudal C 1, partial, partial [Paramuricea clavata]